MILKKDPVILKYVLSASYKFDADMKIGFCLSAGD